MNSLFALHDPALQDAELSAMIGRILTIIADRAPRAWLVGGYVRDRLLGRPTHDLDIIVPEGGIALARAIAAALGGDSFVLDLERDVGRALVRGAAGQTLEVDVARLRVPDLVGDLSLRDFTINAMAVEIGPGPAPVALGPEVLIDPFGGREDLARGWVRAVGDGAFRDDPLRTLRAVRLVVELGLQIEETTQALIRRDAPLLRDVSAERVRDELMRIIPAPGAWQHLRLLASLNLLAQVLPDVAATIGVQQTAPHYQDVFDHTRSVMAHLEGIFALLWPESAYVRPTPVPDDATLLAPDSCWDEVAQVLAPFAADLRTHLEQPLAAGRTRRQWLPWAALAHDGGKPAMRTVDPNGRARFLEHDHWGALLIERRGQALRFASDEIAYLVRLVHQHMRPGQLAHDYPPSRRAIYRFYRDAGDTGPDCVLLALADRLALVGWQLDRESWRRRLGTSTLLLQAYFRERRTQVDPPSLLNGHQLMAEFGLTPGPHIGELLEGLREAQAAGEVSNAEEARAWLALQLKPPPPTIL